MADLECKGSIKIVNFFLLRILKNHMLLFFILLKNLFTKKIDVKLFIVILKKHVGNYLVISVSLGSFTFNR